MLFRSIVKQLETLPFVKFPFDSQMLPNNGIYFFFENGENWGHGGNNPRIVRIGTHKDGNFQNRIKEHFIINDSKMNFTALQSPPHDRSISQYSFFCLWLIVFKKHQLTWSFPRNHA